MARRKHYHVYVVELSNDVLLNARFMRSNPDYQPGNPCVGGSIPPRATNDSPVKTPTHAVGVFVYGYTKSSCLVYVRCLAVTLRDGGKSKPIRAFP
ncbi:MAG: hypothetical protein CO065_15415 [Comamonadaceae bacterium CG_4_9_14_0_8_um_filter_57_21]|nr:MAG: hypothetical protein CO065_15415 [Comamonadaceae bacterium CG_4_9_14_0_8_um_filter_57_21]